MGIVDTISVSTTALRTWARVPTGLWVTAEKIDEARGELLTLQRLDDRHTLSQADVDGAVCAYHDLTIWAAENSCDPNTSMIRVWGGDVDALKQADNLQRGRPEMCTLIRIRQAKITVCRTLAPSWSERRGRCMTREVHGPGPEDPHCADRAPSMGGAAGCHFDGRWNFGGRWGES